MARVKTDHCVVTWTLVNVVKYCSTFTPSYHISNAQNIPRYYAVEEGINTNGKRSNKMVALSHPNSLFFNWFFWFTFLKNEPLSASDFLLPIITLERFHLRSLTPYTYEVQMIFLFQKPA